MKSYLSWLVGGAACLASVLPASASGLADRASLEALISQYARAHGVPEALVHRVVRRESNYNPRAVSRGNYGLMQIRQATAQGMGYTGSSAGLLDAKTNLTYAVPYLANAYKVAGGNQDRAVALYSRGYYYEAKRMGLLASLKRGGPIAAEPAQVAAPQPAAPVSLFASLFSPAPAEPQPAVQAAAETVQESPEPVAKARPKAARAGGRKTKVAKAKAPRPQVADGTPGEP